LFRCSLALKYDTISPARCQRLFQFFYVSFSALAFCPVFLPLFSLLLRLLRQNCSRAVHISFIISYIHYIEQIIFLAFFATFRGVPNRFVSFTRLSSEKGASFLLKPPKHKMLWYIAWLIAK
jgi:hypothetical protein